MSFDPALFNNVASHLPDRTELDKEARTRTSFGRSYYALYLAVQSVIRREQGRPIDERIGHGALKDALFSSASTAELRALGKALDQLYEARQKADYVLEPGQNWRKTLNAPQQAAYHARFSAAELRKLESLDFSAILGLI